MPLNATGCQNTLELYLLHVHESYLSKKDLTALV